MNVKVPMHGQCPFHAELQQKGKNFDMFAVPYQQDPALALKEFVHNSRFFSLKRWVTGL